jgi:hypothetical protein
MNFPQAFTTAASCAKSPRAIRREASYRFYLANGVDDAAREVLAETVWDKSTRYRKVVASDQQLILKLGLAQVLELAPTTYWRMVAITKVLEPANYVDTINTSADYPLELIWTISECRLVNLVQEVSHLLEQYKDDAYLLNRILQCLARLGDATSIALAMDYAADLLGREGSLEVTYCSPGATPVIERYPS